MNPQSKPNVLFILADDQRFDTISALGNKEIHTPNLDRLAARGTAFTRAHIPGGTSGAVCMPSRAMLNSGKTLFHLYKEGQEIPLKDTTMGQCFKENGYRTIGIGKWHNGTESYARSFTDGDCIFFGGMWDHWNVPVCHYHEDGVYEKTANFIPDFFHANHPMPMICDTLAPGVHSTELFTDAATRFIKESKDSEDPFFMYLAYLAPHDPRSMPKEFREMYDPEKITLPESFTESHPFLYCTEEHCRKMRDEALASYPRNENEIRRHICDYYGMISHIDHNIGRLLEALEESGQLDNTIIVFTGDNGLAVGRHGLMGKQNLYEHSVRIPLMISGPAVKKSCLSEEYVYLLDIYPTLCELTGIEIPASVEGKPFTAACRGESANTRADLYLAYTGEIRGVKDSRYKLLEYRLDNGSKHTELFDLANDPNELKNLSSDMGYSDILASLRARLKEYKSEWENNPENIHSEKYWY